jgi:hypothetical protein
MFKGTFSFEDGTKKDSIWFENLLEFWNSNVVDVGRSMSVTVWNSEGFRDAVWVRLGPGRQLVLVGGAKWKGPKQGKDIQDEGQTMLFQEES